MIKRSVFKKISTIIFTTFFIYSFIFPYLLISNVVVKPVLATTVSDSYTDTTKINTGASSNYQVTGGQAKLTLSAVIGTGADGACTVSGTTNINTQSCAGRGTADGINFSVTANTASGQNQITVSTTPTGLAVNNEILIINLQGTNGGTYETNTISAINSNTLTLGGNLTNAYNGTTDKIVVQRIPQYTSVTISSGATLTADAWNGTKGGVVFFRANGTFSNSGTINANTLGYRGAAQNTASYAQGYQGEGYTAAGGATSNPNTVGGGGGRYICSTGGCPWASASGGGGGAYGAGGTDGGGFTGQGTSAPGFGGVAAGVANLTTLIFGGGGGAGGSTCGGYGAGGGTGGGIIYIAANTVTNSGSITANGATAPSNSSNQTCNGATTGGAGGGGGAGGAIYIEGNTLTLGASTVTANAGGGSSGTYNGVGGVWPGPGGAGGVGRIAVKYLNAPSGSTSPGATSTQITNSYLTSAVIQSINLLSVETNTVGPISSFVYNLSTLPAGTTATIQFSQNATSWYDSAGTLNSSNSLSTGTNNTISLSALSWTGANFYYKLAMTSTGANTPTLDDITVNYSLNNIPSAPTVSSPTNGQTGLALLPVVQLSTTDAESDYLRYKIQMATDTGFTANLQTFDETTSQTGWSGQNAQIGSAYNSGSTATYTVQSNLTYGAIYYIRAYAIDPGGSNQWSNLSSTISFTIKTLDAPTNCNLSAASPTGPAVVTWTDNSTFEENYLLETSVNGGAFTLTATLAPNTTSSSQTVATGTYQYRIRAVASNQYSSYCTTILTSFPLNSVKFEGIQFNGIQVR